MLKLNSVPSRAIASVKPNEKASSLPLNQRARMALCATTSDSLPAPKTSRPRPATVTFGATATMQAPITMSPEKIRLAQRVPIRSMSMPPRNTTTMAATE